MRRHELGLLQRAVPALARRRHRRHLAIAIGTLASYVPLYLLGLAAGVVLQWLHAASWGEIGFQAVYQGGLAMLVAGIAFTQVVSTSARCARP